MPRDAIWVMPNGVTKVVTLDDDGNLIEDVPAAEPAEPANAAKPAEPAPPPDPDLPQPRQHRRRNRR
jgi:hypothetical protein